MMEFGPFARKLLGNLITGATGLLTADVTAWNPWALMVLTALGGALGIQAVSDTNKRRKAKALQEDSDL